jgi:predicted NodU family carbamoyl transferase
MTHPDILVTLQAYAQDVEEGKVNALSAYVEMKALSELIGSMMDNLKDQAIEERRKYGKEEVIKNGYKIELANGRKIWKYDSSQRWQQINAQRKTYEELMQKAYAGAQIADAETGELIPAAELSFASDTIRLTEVK